MRLSECARDRIVLGRRGMVAGEMGLTRWRKLGDRTQEAWWHADVRVCSGSNCNWGRGTVAGEMGMTRFCSIWMTRSCLIWDFRVCIECCCHGTRRAWHKVCA